jgi:hypothetical protein
MAQNHIRLSLHRALDCRLGAVTTPSVSNQFVLRSILGNRPTSDYYYYLLLLLLLLLLFLGGSETVVVHHSLLSRAGQADLPTFTQGGARKGRKTDYFFRHRRETTLTR